MEPDDLRRRAEDRLAASLQAPAMPPQSLHDALRLVHELRVHQIELEMQNEELQRTHAQLENAFVQYSELYDFAPVGYFSLGEDGAIHRVNLCGAALIGLPRGDLHLRRFGVFVCDADRPRFNAAMADVFGPMGRATLDLTLDVPDASLELQVHVTLALSPGADTCRAIVVDVTERKRAEHQQRSSQKMEAIGRLAGGVAHDFNNLLTVILSHAAFALEAVEPGPLHSDLEDLQKAAERAVGLTRQLLAFSRKQVLRTQLVDVNELTRALAVMLRRLLGENIEVVMDLAIELGRVQLDPAQLEQVVMNLAINARDAMPGGGTLTLQTCNVGAFVRLTVTDTGSGMDNATMGHVFEPFFTTKQLGRGTGFGLSTVYGIVMQCGGDVSVRSEPGKGSTFEVLLPRATATAPVRKEPRKVVPVGGGGETILVVEDELALRGIFSRFLRAAGYVVLVAENGVDALQVARQHVGPIHLVVSDVVMPKMSGIAFAHQLVETRPHTKVLFMSGYTDEAVKPHGALESSVPFIGKPFTAAELDARIRELLDTRGSDPAGQNLQQRNPTQS
ncbi:MAG: response regulator [Myxococcales bacterium]|nr:response regulator [Myxococcales bacterium]